MKLSASFFYKCYKSQYKENWGFFMPYHLKQRIWLFLCVVLLSFPNVESLVFANGHVNQHWRGRNVTFVSTNETTTFGVFEHGNHGKSWWNRSFWFSVNFKTWGNGLHETGRLIAREGCLFKASGISKGRDLTRSVFSHLLQKVHNYNNDRKWKRSKSELLIHVTINITLEKCVVVAKGAKLSGAFKYIEG